MTLFQLKKKKMQLFEPLNHNNITKKKMICKGKIKLITMFNIKSKKNDATCTQHTLKKVDNITIYYHKEFRWYNFINLYVLFFS